MMVHRFVFDDFVQHGFKSWQGAIDLPTLVAEGMQVVADIRKDRAEIAGSDDLAKLRREMQRLRRFATGHTPFVGSFRSNESGYLYTAHNFSSYKNLIEDSADSPDIEAIITELSKFILFRANMDSMQFLWSPQIGSQNDTDKDLSRFYATCERYIQERARLYREEWGDLDDDC